MNASAPSSRRRAIGIVRVSQTKGREGESFHSPETQRGRIRGAAEQHGWELLDVVPELDVSGGKRLDERPRLLAAVEQIEAGRADVLATAYLDRLTRDPRVRDEVVERVEAAGGQVWTVDMGRQTNGTAAEQLTGTLASAVHRYVRRVNAERSAEAQQRAIARGVPPWAGAPLGYERGEDGRLRPDADTAQLVADAFRLRADGATIERVREHLRDHGVERSYHGVQHLLCSRVVLGEIHFGGYEPNLSAHPAIVDRETWQRAVRVRVPRGRRAKSDRLLARQEILRCGTCGSRMVVGTANHGTYPLYRCPPTGDCPRRVTVSANLVEGIVIDAVRAALADAEGRAQAEDSARQAVADLERAQSELDALIEILDPLEPAARKRLVAATERRDEARAAVDRLGDSAGAVVVRGWDDRLTLDERRALIRAVVERVDVAPGRGPDRVTVHLLGE